MQLDPHPSHSYDRPHACIWMQAGVIRSKTCRQDFHCESCRFDRSLRRAVDQNRRARASGKPLRGPRGQLVSWRRRLMEMPPARRPCLHHMKERIPFRACTHDYACSDCEFDQFFNDQYIVHAVVKPVDVVDISGVKIPQGYYLHPGHVWVKLEEGATVRIGLDDFARRLLGPLDKIEAPLMGKPMLRDGGEITVRRETGSATLRSPLSGVITDVNPRLRQTGAWSVGDAYAEGWLVRLHASDLRQELKHLMIGAQSTEFLQAEIDGLFELIEHAEGPLAADGGCLAEDILGKLPSLGWQSVARRFLRS